VSRKRLSVILCLMSQQPFPPTNIEIELSSTASPISGTIRVAGLELEFAGWLELINLIEDRRSGSSGPAHPPRRG
jgi:hypothetical protein